MEDGTQIGFVSQCYSRNKNIMYESCCICIRKVLIGIFLVKQNSDKHEVVKEVSKIETLRNSEFRNVF